MSKYTGQRLAALYERVDKLEHAIEEAGAALEPSVVDPGKALDALRAGIMETFRGSLLCDMHTTDAHLDHWLAEATAAEQGVSP